MSNGPNVYFESNEPNICFESNGHKLHFDFSKGANYPKSRSLGFIGGGGEAERGNDILINR